MQNVDNKREREKVMVSVHCYQPQMREQMQDNLSYMKDFNGLTEKEQETLKKAQEELKKIPLIPCTTCNYCAKVCPMEIGVSGSFTAMNYLTLYGSKDQALHQEEWLVGKHGRKSANECVKCGKCEEVCPQHIKIRDELEKIADRLGKVDRGEEDGV